jgi:sugar phosphate permease
MYSAGDCSVCVSAGFAIFVKGLEDGRIFLACPECGCAWAKPPEAFLVDTVNAATVFAPNGFCLATPDEIASAGLADLVKNDVAGSSSGFHGMAGFRDR